MTSPPVTVLDAFAPAPDPGKQLVDPASFYQALMLTLGYQQPTASPQAPGPVLTAAVNTITVPSGSGAGPFNIRMPVALGGLRLTLINLTSGGVNLNMSYNPAVGRYDQLIGTSPMPSGIVYAAVAYLPGNWYVAPVTTGLPGDEPVIVSPDDTPPPEEC